jgi:hypothetical protein
MPIIKRGKVEIIEILPEKEKPAEEEEVRKQIKEAKEKELF